MLEFLNCARYSQLSVVKGYIVKIIAWCFITLGFTGFAYAEDVNGQGCACTSARGNVCPQDNLSRNVVYDELSMHRQLDALSISGIRNDMLLSKINVPLTRGHFTPALSMSRTNNPLSRGQTTEALTFSKKRHDLSLGMPTAELTFGKRGPDLTRGAYTANLSFSKQRDDLSRGRDTEPLSRCD
jgi:hypothetical protein